MPKKPDPYQDRIRQPKLNRPKLSPKEIREQLNMTDDKGKGKK
jgi:hypothetical protein